MCDVVNSYKFLNDFVVFTPPRFYTDTRVDIYRSRLIIVFKKLVIKTQSTFQTISFQMVNHVFHNNYNNPYSGHR